MPNYIDSIRTKTNKNKIVRELNSMVASKITYKADDGLNIDSMMLLPHMFIKPAAREC